MDEENPKPQSQPPSPSAPTANRSHCVIDNFRSFLVTCAMASTTPPLPLPANSIASPHETFIKMQIQHLLPTIFHTPDHPPYAWMVDNAIEQLNQEGGSSEEAISNFILNGHKQLPWAHAALLKYHLRKLTERNILVQSDEGFYMIGKASISPEGTSKPIPPTTSPSPSLSLNSSPFASCSSSSTYASSSTSGSSQSFSPKGKGKNRMKKNVRALCCGRGAKGQGKGQGQAWDAGQDWDWTYDPALMKNAMREVFVSQLEGEGETTEAQYLKEEVEATDKSIQGNNQLKGPIVQNSIDVECQSAEGTILIDVDPYEQHHRVNNKRIDLLQQGKECGERNVRPHKRSAPAKHTGKGRGITHRKALHRDETGKNLKPPESTERVSFTEEDKQKTEEQSQLKEELCYRPSFEVPDLACDSLSAAKAMGEQELDYMNKMEQTEGDVLDELIEEVYIELMEATTASHQMIEDEGHLGRNEHHHQVKGSQGPVDVECQVEPSSMIIEIEGPEEEKMVIVD